MIPFFKLSGSGNDFLALAEPAREPEAAEVRAWCSRRLSAGADGLFVLRRSADAARMTHFNADGGRAELCLNGARCAARLAFDLGWARDRLVLETDAGALAARRLGGSAIALELPPPSGPPAARRLELDGRSVEGWWVRVGVPHLVVAWPEGLGGAPVAELGPRLRRHPDLGPEGANVDFVRFPDRHRLEIRTFERGVEDETLACGTGVLSAVATGLALDRLELPVSALTRGGFVLEVEGEARDKLPIRWSLAGDVTLVARGTLLPEAARLPPPPAWSG